MEPRALLSGAGAGLTETLTTDKPVYQVGEPVKMTLTETNTSDHDVQLAEGAVNDGFFVAQNGATVWFSNTGAQPASIALIDLHPGESHTIQATWDGHPNNNVINNPLESESPATPTGTFEIHSQFDREAMATFAIQTTPVPTPTPTPTPVAQPLAVGVTTNRALYRRGRPVVVSLTETNTTDHDVPVLTGGHVLSASASGPGGPVWQFRDRRALPTGFGVLHAHQSRHIQFVWTGRPDLPRARIVPGVYLIQAGLDGVSGTAAVPITR